MYTVHSTHVYSTCRSKYMLVSLYPDYIPVAMVECNIFLAMEVKGECKALAPVQSQENPYELVDFNTNVRRNDDQSREATASWNKGSKQSTWSTPLVVIALLLCLIVLLLVVILCLLLVQLFARDAISTSTSTTTTGATAGNTEYPNFTQWANDIVSRVNSNVTGSLPDFNEWANGVVSKVTSNVTGSLPDFNEWANGVVSKVNSNVTGSLPDFNEWSNGVVSKVNSNVTGSLPDFNEWANDVSQNTLQLFQNNTNFTQLDEQILQTTRDSAQKLINIVNTLSNLQDTSTSTAGLVDDTFLTIIHLLLLHNSSFGYSTSCEHIKMLFPASPSRYYILGNGSATYTAYCNMGTLCGSGGGWTRLAYLNMSDATQNCPSGFRLYQSGGVRACGRPVTSSGSCVSVQFPSNGISYSQICGRVVGHSYETPDAVNSNIGSNHNNIDSYYVDGVSITRGSPRQHIWTLMATGAEIFGSGGHYNCPCTNGSTQVPQSFVGSHYFCEGAGGNWNDLLWDGKDCSADEALCCSAPGLPWFHRDYGSTTTTDYIELRVCSDQETTDEDVPVSFYEIYIK